MPNEIIIDVDGTLINRPVNANQVNKLSRVVQEDNVQRASADPPLPAQSVNEFLEASLISSFLIWTKQSDNLSDADLVELYNGATQAERDQVDAILAP